MFCVCFGEVFSFKKRSGGFLTQKQFQNAGVFMCKKMYIDSCYNYDCKDKFNFCCLKFNNNLK